MSHLSFSWCCELTTAISSAFHTSEWITLVVNFLEASQGIDIFGLKPIQSVGLSIRNFADEQLAEFLQYMVEDKGNTTARDLVRDENTVGLCVYPCVK